MGLKSIWRSIVKGEHAAAPGAVPLPKEEPLECVIREQRRNEHLQNLGMKRNKSFRKSIAKKFKKKEKPADNLDAGGPSGRHQSDKENVRNVRSHKSSGAPADVQIETRTSIGARIEGGRKIEVIKVDSKKDPASLVGETQPLPAHIQNDVPRKMDKLRRSIRHSIRKRKETTGPEMTKNRKWQLDEAGVRSGTCKFYVKYFGCCEVFESRGMQVCEAAVETLKLQKKRTVRGTMYVSGDSIRLVDDDTKAQIIDQTIEKVSFCAPDRNFDRGFSYICRDGTTRRWMCHAFFAVGDTGERISHAVGCAFGICLENKQKREKESVKVNYNDRDSSFTRVGTFRGLTDRLTDPQALKPSESPKPSLGSTAESSEAFALSRPRPSEMMYQRQASFRGLGQLSGNTPFKRAGKGHTSLRLNDLPSNRDRVGVSLSDSPILEDMELPPSNLEPDTASVVTKSSQSSKTVDLLTSDEPYCYTSELASILTGSSTPALLGADSCSNYSLSPPPPSLLQPMKLGEREKSENPWDNVPDQPALPAPPAQTSADQWLNSLTSSVTQQNSNIFDFNFDSKFVPSDSKLSVEVQPSSSKSTGTSSGYNSPTSSSSQETWQAEVSKSILEDPFDAEWAAIATRNTNTDGDKPEAASDSQATTNPFITTDSTVKAFELQL